MAGAELYLMTDQCFFPLKGRLETVSYLSRGLKNSPQYLRARRWLQQLAEIPSRDCSVITNDKIDES